MRTILFILLIGLGLPLVAQQPLVSDSASIAEANTATLYFYRKPEFYSGRFECWVNDVRVISNFQAANYFWLNLPAGAYEIRTIGKPRWAFFEKKYQLKVEAGQDYYIEAVLNYDFLGTGLSLEERTQTDFEQLQDKINFNADALRQLD